MKQMIVVNHQKIHQYKIKKKLINKAYIGNQFKNTFLL